MEQPLIVSIAYWLDWNLINGWVSLVMLCVLFSYDLSNAQRPFRGAIVGFAVWVALRLIVNGTGIG